MQCLQVIGAKNCYPHPVPAEVSTIMLQGGMTFMHDYNHVMRWCLNLKKMHCMYALILAILKGN